MMAVSQRDKDRARLSEHRHRGMMRFIFPRLSINITRVETEIQTIPTLKILTRIEAENLEQEILIMVYRQHGLLLICHAKENVCWFNGVLNPFLLLFLMTKEAP